jgi:glycosyltransferase involved in cell wall biosynthesis
METIMGLYFPLVSIITPSYMQGKYIEDTIMSVSDQTYKNLEHVILDSCSTDETDSIINKHLGRYNLIYIREKDKGQANAINKGLDLCNGEIVCWLNSDDIFFDNYVIERIVGIFNSRPTIDIITGDGYFVDSGLNLVSPITIPNIEYLSIDYMKVFDVFLQPSTFWKKNDIRLDEALNYTFDWKFFIEFYKRNKSILYVREYLSCYRVHETGKTKTDTARRKKEILSTVKYNESSKVNIIWNFIVLLLYSMSEKLSMPIIKKIARHANHHIANLSKKKIYSC